MSTPRTSAQAGNSETNAIRVTSNTHARATKELEDEIQKEINNSKPHSDQEARAEQFLKFINDSANAQTK